MPGGPFWIGCPVEIGEDHLPIYRAAIRGESASSVPPISCFSETLLDPLEGLLSGKKGRERIVRLLLVVSTRRERDNALPLLALGHDAASSRRRRFSRTKRTSRLGCIMRKSLPLRSSMLSRWHLIVRATDIASIVFPSSSNAGHMRISTSTSSLAAVESSSMSQTIPNGAPDCSL